MSNLREADVTLSDGREIRFDLSRINVKEWRTMVDPKSSHEEEDALIAKVAGLQPEEIEELNYVDWRRMTAALWKRAAKPLDDPN